MKSDFWRDKRVFVTGHTGFKGSWLSLWLQSFQVKVTGYSLEPPTRPNLFELASVSSEMHSIFADIRDLQRLKAEMAAAQPDIVIHMAAQPLVRLSYNDPVATYATNVMGTVHLLEAVRATPSVRAVVNVTTDKCYENREWVWGYRENEPMGGYDPYSSSKGCAELVSAAYRSSYFDIEKYSEHRLALATARSGNVIGGGDWASDRLIPDLINAFRCGKPAIIRSPDAIRPWQHVLEPLRGYLMLAEKLYSEGTAWGEAWNFGPNDDDARPVAWIADYLARLWGSNASWVADKAQRPHEATYLKLDISKARSRLGWNPLLSLARSLELTADWHRALTEGADVRKVSVDQIQQYSAVSGVGS